MATTITASSQVVFTTTTLPLAERVADCLREMGHAVSCDSKESGDVAVWVTGGLDAEQLGEVRLLCLAFELGWRHGFADGRQAELARLVG